MMQFDTVYIGTQEGYKSLKMLSDSISEDAIFQNFLEGMPPDPLVLACFACMCALHTMTQLSCFLAISRSPAGPNQNCFRRP